MSDNVIKFPIGLQADGPPMTEADVDDRILSMREYHVQSTIAQLIMNMAPALEISGFAIPDPDEHDQEEEAIRFKSFALAIEALRAFLYLDYGIEHPLHQITEQIVDRDDEGVYIVSDDTCSLIEERLSNT